MADDVDWDPNWWRAAKALSIERKAEAAEAAARALAGDSFLIVTEGTVTEPIYFKALRAALHLSAVKVVVEPGDATDARQVVDSASRRAISLEKRAARGGLAIDEPMKYDQVWAVLDTDVPERHNHWPEIVAYAAARNVRLAYSTPCFEFWLLLHIRFTTAPLQNGATAKSVLKEAIGEYSTNEATTQAAVTNLLAHWPTAVERGGQVRQYHIDAATPPPANPSTRVDRLVLALNYSAPVHARRLHPH
jgi:hypothetical protein